MTARDELERLTDGEFQNIRAHWRGIEGDLAERRLREIERESDAGSTAAALVHSMEGDAVSPKAIARQGGEEIEVEWSNRDIEDDGILSVVLKGAAYDDLEDLIRTGDFELEFADGMAARVRIVNLWQSGGWAQAITESLEPVEKK